MRIGQKSPSRTGITAANTKKPGNVGGVKAASNGNTKDGKDHKPISVKSGDGVKGGSDPMQAASRPQANFGKTGKGDPSASYGSNANVKAGKYH